jgi:hypothetical protein
LRCTTCRARAGLHSTAAGPADRRAQYLHSSRQVDVLARPHLPPAPGGRQRAGADRQVGAVHMGVSVLQSMSAPPASPQLRWQPRAGADRAQHQISAGVGATDQVRQPISWHRRIGIGAGQQHGARVRGSVDTLQRHVGTPCPGNADGLRIDGRRDDALEARHHRGRAVAAAIEGHDDVHDHPTANHRRRRVRRGQHRGQTTCHATFLICCRDHHADPTDHSTIPSHWATDRPSPVQTSSTKSSSTWVTIRPRPRPMARWTSSAECGCSGASRLQ